MRRHYKHTAESDEGIGTAYIEIMNGWPTRQVEIYGEVWRWGDEEHPEYLADQPFTELDLDEDHSIGVDEFEQVWREALVRCPRSS